MNSEFKKAKEYLFWKIDSLVDIPLKEQILVWGSKGYIKCPRTRGQLPSFEIWKKLKEFNLK